MGDQRVYKIVDAATWEAVRMSPAWLGSDLDRRDGFVHFSTAAQLPGTLAAHYAGRRDLVIAAFDVAAFGAALKWEPSRGGDLFPHLYAPLAPAAVHGVWRVDVAADGACTLPKDITG